MFANLPEIKKVIKTISQETDELEKLTHRVNEIMCDEIIKDFTINRFKKDKNEVYFTYEVKSDDYFHIVDFLNEIQTIVSPDMVIMAQSNMVDNFKIMFRKVEIK